SRLLRRPWPLFYPPLQMPSNCRATCQNDPFHSPKKLARGLLSRGCEGGSWMTLKLERRSDGGRAGRDGQAGRLKPPRGERDMRTSPLSIDVYVAPMRPYTCPDQLGEGEVATWAPSSSTLISGPTEGILI